MKFREQKFPVIQYFHLLPPAVYRHKLQSRLNSTQFSLRLHPDSRLFCPLVKGIVFVLVLVVSPSKLTSSEYNRSWCVPFNFSTFWLPWSFLIVYSKPKLSETVSISHLLFQIVRNRKCVSQIRGYADKSLARPGRKQATATKLGIYSTYSPRSSIHFLAHCSNFYKQLKKKKIRMLSVQPGLRGINDLRVGRKMANFQLFVQSRKQVVVLRSQIRRVWWVIKTLEAQVGQLLLDCMCPASRGVVVQEQDLLGDLHVPFFLQNVLQLHQQRWVILRVDSLTLWKIINENDAVLIQKKSRRELFQRIFAFGIFWRGVSRYAATPLIVALSPGHSDTTRFRPWSPIVPDRKSFGWRRKNSKSCSDDRHRWRFWSAFRHFGTHFAESFRVSKSSWMMDPTRSHEMPSCSSIDLAEIRRSSKINCEFDQ